MAEETGAGGSNAAGSSMAGPKGLATALRPFSLALLLSGFAALCYQVAWQRVLTQLIGSDAVSTTLVVTIFMICLGLGSELAGYVVSRSPSQALRLYVLIEVLVGLYGVASISILRTVNVGGAGADESIVHDFSTNLLLLCAPIIGMGITTPLIVHVAKQSLQNVGRTVGILYGWNIAGAALGSAVTGLVLIEVLGLRGTTLVAAALNVCAAVVAVRALRSVAPARSATGPGQAPAPAASISAALSVAAVLFGFGTLAVQAIFFRVLSNYLTLSSVVFPILLCSYLCLMSLGQWLGGRLADRFSGQLPVVAAGLFAAGSLLFVAALRFPPAWAASLGALRFSSFNGQLVAADYPALVGDPSVVTVLSFSFLLMLSVAAWSGIFPVVFRLLTDRVENAGNRFARVYTLYTVGNVIGAFLCGIVMLPLLGTGASAMITVLVLGAGAFLLLMFQRSRAASRPKAWLAAGIGVLLAFLVPLDYYRSFALGNYAVAEVFEGRTGVATVVPTSKFYTIVDMNRTASASALRADPRAEDLYQAWRWNHSELMAFDDAFRPRHILVIGIGHAYLIDAMLDLPFVEKITVVDISAEVVEAVRKHTATSTRRIFEDPRVEVVVADGRRFVQSAIRRGQSYDLIQNKINEPWHAGSSNLFTEEFFAEEKKALRPGGYLSTRPLTGHLTDGLKVFGNALWGGYYHMYFKNGHVAVPPAAVVTPDIRTAWHAALPGQEAVQPVARAILPMTVFRSVPDELRTDANTDDRPTFEYYFVRQLMGSWRSPRQQFWDMDLRRYTIDLPVQER